MQYKSLLFIVKMLCVIAVSLFMVYASMLKLVDYPGMEDSFIYWGYPPWLMYVVGVLELIIAVMVYIPKTRWIGVGLLWVHMAGAIYTHIIHNEYDQLTSAIAMLSLSLVVLLSEWITRHLHPSSS